MSRPSNPADAVVRHQADLLLRACPVRPLVAKRPAAPPRTRPLGDPAALSLYSARARVRPELASRLVELAEVASTQVSTRVLRELLAVASHRLTTALFVDAVGRLLVIPLFGALPEAEQLEVLGLLRATIAHPPMTEKLLELLAQPSLRGLPAAERLRLLTYAVGPGSGPCSAAEHAGVLMGAWMQRAHKVHALLGEGPGLDEVERFLLEPAQPLHLLRTPADVDLLIVAFGPLNAPSTLSYSRSSCADPAGDTEAAVVSPSPLIASSWRTRTPIAGRIFEVRSTSLTRLEELELVRWIEHNHVIGRTPVRVRGQRSVGLFLNALRFAEAVEPIANRVASVRGPLRFHRALLRRGLPVRGRAEGSRARPAPSKQALPRAGRAPALIGGSHG